MFTLTPCVVFFNTVKGYYKFEKRIYFNPMLCLYFSPMEIKI